MQKMSKKLSNILVLLLLIANVFMTPLKAWAQEEGAVEQPVISEVTPTEESDISLQEEEPAPPAEEEQSEESSSSSSEEEAKEEEAKKEEEVMGAPLTNYTVATDFKVNANAVVNNASYGEAKFYITPTFAFPDDVVLKNGDTVSYQIPAPFKVDAGLTTDISAGGEVVARLVTSTDSKVATVTVLNQDYFARLSETKKITASFTVVWDHPNAPLNTPVTFELQGYPASPVTLTRILVDEELNAHSKWGSQSSQDLSLVNWRIRVNRDVQAIGPVTLVDEIPDNQELVGPITGLYFDSWNFTEQRGNYLSGPERDFDSNSVQVEGHKFTINLPDMSQKGVILMYQTRIVGEVDKVGKKVYNELTMTSNQGTFHKDDWFASLRVVDGIGEGARSDEVIFQVTKVLEGGRALAAKEFEFELVAPDGSVLQTASNDAAGLVKFRRVKFPNVGQFVYTIREKAGTIPGVTYDTSVITATVDVTDNGGAKTANVVYSKEQFTNVYKSGSVVVKYEDEAGTSISADKEVLPAGTAVGTDYNTTTPDVRLPEIVKDDITYVLKSETPKAGSADAVGKVVEGQNVVTYVYAPKPGGAVTVKYEDANGATVSPDKVVAPAGTPVGTPYDTTTAENRPAELVKDGITYALTSQDPKAGSAEATGRVAAEEKVVTYVYAPKAGGSVTVKYEDTAGESLVADKEVLPVGTPVGTPYDTTTAENRPAELVKGGITYTLTQDEPKAGSADAIGTVSTENKVVTYVYAPKAGGSVTVKYEDAAGTTVAPDKLVVPGTTPVGTPYDTTTPDVRLPELEKDGITYVLTSETPKAGSADAVGTVSTEDKVVTYVYAPKAGGSVTVKYEDANGATVSPDKVVAPAGTPVGTPYDTTTAENRPAELVKDGITYELTAQDPKAGSADAIGTVGVDAKVVTYVYAPKAGGSVTVKYEDANGTSISADKEIAPTGTPVGTPYDTTTAENRPTEVVYNGITYVLTSQDPKAGSADAVGAVSTEDKVVTYVYAPKAGGSVTVKYEDANGATVSPDKVVAPAGTPVGTPYDTTTLENRPAELVKDGITYALTSQDPKAGSADATGMVEVDSKVVTYVYAPKAGGSVTVKYEDESGKTVAPDKLVAPGTTPVGTPYDTTTPENRPAELVKDGIAYVLTSETPKVGSADAVGTVSTENKVVTYVYAPKAGGAVTVKYEATNGATIAADKVVSPAGTPVGTPYDTTTPENRPAEIVSEGKAYVLTSETPKAGSAEATGLVTEMAKVVTYVYALKELPAPAATTVVLTAKKELAGRELKADEFQFELVDASGQVVQKVANTKDGNVVFSPIVYTTAGQYRYVLREVKGTDATVTYDAKEVPVEVTVTAEGDKLVAKAVYGNEAVFKNTYKDPKKEKGILPKTGEAATFGFILAGLIFFLTAAGLVFYNKKRN